jgi:hypothetical protein
MGLDSSLERDEAQERLPGPALHRVCDRGPLGPKLLPAAARAIV